MCELACKMKNAENSSENVFKLGYDKAMQAKEIKI